MDDLSAWRENREGKWFRDIGYALQDVLRGHRYEIRKKGSKPDDPGWHECSCGWEGYWSDFHPHVTDHLRAVVVQAEQSPPVPPPRVTPHASGDTPDASTCDG